MVIIIGAGLSGLLTAYRLQKQNIPYKILEAKPRIGGRIHAIQSDRGARIDMGATWFGPQHQHLMKLLNELGIKYFPQFHTSSFFYYNPNGPSHGKHPFPPQEESFRVEGGTSEIVNALLGKINTNNLFLNSPVRELHFNDTEFRIGVEGGKEFEADKVILSLPPKVWSHYIDFTPTLSEDLLGIARETQTWMEDSIKAAVEFKSSFWRRDNRAATIISQTGPLAEFYDHNQNLSRGSVMCGFINNRYNTIEPQKREQLVNRQLLDIYGQVVTSEKVGYKEYNWSEDEWVKTKNSDLLMPHQNNGHPLFRSKQYEGKLILSGTETAPHYAGYMEGAVIAAQEAAQII